MDFEQHNLSVGNGILDSAHKELLNIIDWMPQLIDVEDADTLLQAFEVLMDRLRSCFVVEENIARAVDFDFKQHEIAHQHLLDVYMRTENELMAKYGMLPKIDAKKYIFSLRDHLISHINEEGALLKLALRNHSYDFKPSCAGIGLPGRR